MKPFLKPRKLFSKLGYPPRPSSRSRVLQRLFGYLAAYPAQLTLIVLLVVVGTIANLVVAYLLGVGINNLSAPSPDLTGLLQTVTWMGIAGVVSWGLLLIEGLLLANISQKATFQLRRDLFEHIQTLSLNFFDRQPIGELMSRVTSDTELISQFFQTGLNQLFVNTARLVFTAIAMVLLDWRLAIAALTIGPLMLAFIGLLGRVSGPAFDQLQQELGELNGLMEETISGEKTVIAYRRQDAAVASFEEISLASREASVKAQFIALISRPVTLVLTNLDVALVALVGGLLVLQGATNVGVVATFLQYTRQLALPLTQLSNLFNALLAALSGAERVFQILDEQPAIVDAIDAAPMPMIQGRVEFRQVDFSYVQGRQILKHNTFAAQPGEKIGLCGPTGAGKSTIINLITRYYDIDAGEILIDGHNITTMQKDSLRQQIGIVLQEAFLFSDTVMNNLRYARLEATAADCIDAAKQANAHDFIERLPQGYDTMLTERGSNLSQGQRQLLTIARMMVQNPRMVILDEATSNVDTRTEQKIQEALDRLMQGRTSFVIAHRLSTIRNANRILVLKAGEIIETGSHDALMQRQGFYYDLYMSQFKGRVAAVV
ncbi:ABC transporter ATP-binding protein [Nodosilinea sp. LEGE 07088]|uniref:ABC transporter ATP-binding protein n=1 Tax=Nodosilinea sp. LEGE 07088 TaxID=2777968 RepID=UPI001882C599|nr:ABC transporter ATP-binding protein [Nodosilinea sp. LEGE 07088]MBE9139797.1 ABC transporter ATP-binding protein [Nodosilinea sp. LEGE 07088]